MANQSPDRRRVMAVLAKAAAVGTFPGFSRWAFAGNVDSPGRVERYEPQYFTAAEYEVLDVLTELIIPADESPGARAAGVSEFIDFLAFHGEAEAREPLREGLRRIHARAAGGSFTKLGEGEQVALLRAMEQDSFFKLLRRYTVMGYYTSRVGLEELDYPGLRMYGQSPECPHTNDPEHRHMPAAKF